MRKFASPPRLRSYSFVHNNQRYFEFGIPALSICIVFTASACVCGFVVKHIRRFSRSVPRVFNIIFQTLSTLHLDGLFLSSHIFLSLPIFYCGQVSPVIINSQFNFLEHKDSIGFQQVSVLECSAIAVRLDVVKNMRGRYSIQHN